MLIFQHFIPRWYKKLPYFADLTQRGDRGWKQAQRQGEDRITLRKTLLPIGKLHVIVALQWRQNVFLTRQVKNICPFSCGAVANFWFLLCMHASASFCWLYTYSQKAIWLNMIKSFLRFLVTRISPNFKKIHQIYIHESSKYPKTLKDFFKNRLSSLAHGQIKWLNLLMNHYHLFFHITKLTCIMFRI